MIVDTSSVVVDPVAISPIIPEPSPILRRHRSHDAADRGTADGALARTHAVDQGTDRGARGSADRSASRGSFQLAIASVAPAQPPSAANVAVRIKGVRISSLLVEDGQPGCDSQRVGCASGRPHVGREFLRASARSLSTSRAMKDDIARLSAAVPT